MPKATYSRIIDHSTDAGFRQWASDMSTALKAVLTQTTDTGQVDWTLGTQTKPGASSYTYYEIYRFSDPLQSTRPIFIKVEYGTGNPTTQPSMRWSIGSATNGAGVLTVIGNTMAMTSMAPHATAAATTYVCYKDGYFAVAFGCMPTPAPGTNTHFFLYVERTKDTVGAATNNGLMYIYNNLSSGLTNGYGWSYDLNANLVNTSSSNSLTPIATSQTSMAAKAKVYPFRFFTPDEYALPSILNVSVSEVNAYNEFDVAPLPGLATWHYLMLGANVVGCNPQALTYWGIAMRYET